MRISVVRAASVLALSAASAAFQSASAQGTGAFVAPYVGYVMHGAWYDGPLGTNLTAASAPVVGAQLGVPLVSGVSLSRQRGVFVW